MTEPGQYRGSGRSEEAVVMELTGGMRVSCSNRRAQEAPESYKDVSAVVDTCHQAGISSKCVRLRPVICIKG